MAYSRRGGLARPAAWGLVPPLVLALVFLIAAVVWWRLDVAARPASVTARFTQALIDRHPGTHVRSVGAAVVEAMLPSGVFVDVRAAALQDACRLQRLRCAGAIDDALDDVDRAEAASRSPNRDALRPAVVGDSSGYRYGFVTAPFFASLELRYVLKADLASTFVTGAIADRLGLSGERLRDAALDGQRRDRPATLQRLVGDGPALYTVRADGDPVAVLLDRDRLAAFAKELGSRKLVFLVPSRGVLDVAAASAATAAALDAMRRTGNSVERTGLEPFTVDLDAPLDASIATMSRVR